MMFLLIGLDGREVYQLPPPSDEAAVLVEYITYKKRLFRYKPNVGQQLLRFHEVEAQLIHNIVPEE